MWKLVAIAIALIIIGKLFGVWGIIALIVIVAAGAGYLNDRDAKKQEALKAKRAEEERIAEIRRVNERRAAERELAEAQRIAEEKRAAEEAEKRRRYEDALKAYKAEVAEIISAPVEVSDSPAPMLSVSVYGEIKYSTITARSPLAGIGNFVAIDVETTGLKASKDEIVDVAAVRFRDFEPVEKFESLCFPKKGLSEEAAKINGITAEMVEGQPTFQQIAESLKAFIGTDNIVGHNLGFDLGFIGKYGVDLTGAKRKYYDTLDIARKTLKKDTFRKKYDREYDFYDEEVVLGEVRNHNLETLCAHYGIFNPESHRAFGDALAAGKLFEKLVEARS